MFGFGRRIPRGPRGVRCCTTSGRRGEAGTSDVDTYEFPARGRECDVAWTSITLPHGADQVTSLQRPGKVRGTRGAANDVPKLVMDLRRAVDL